ncbi:NAD(P)H-dependent oxidoreductase [Methylobacterium brachythecii]|uniref:NAD(P)H dehydrogenase (Quinone) n=1 Tax=Methylobacterium brachythecii TaxID=1176177 RepID=A0A7W6F6W2_9HYPH|nr:NAD(P)H-dependent oxidoreductase [Methylobacterium brachythecii]MBB3902733.1 NAD(P)H dehydrogenase (quinone) [Methylobacterium brachythecii]GLS42575.1 hypothetical protein GCM10007884_05600 [Methylobacterium brachythecii]
MSAPNILIVFFAGNEATEALALVIAEGARAAGAAVRLRRTPHASGADATAYDPPTVEDAVWADAILFGTPRLFGSIPSELSLYLDGLDDVRLRGALNGTFGGVFGAPDAAQNSGRSTVLSLYDRLVALGLIIVPLGYSHLAPNAIRPRSDEDRAAARRQGGRIAAVAAQAIAEPLLGRAA